MLGALLFLSAVLYVLYRRYFRISIADIPGPEPESFILGNLRQLLQSAAGEKEFEWQNIFGGITRIKGPFNEDRLWISDPKALHYICQTSGYHHPKPVDRREFARLITDDGILWAEGDVHKRHKKVMLPAFGIMQVKAFFPLFHEIAAKLVTKWKDLITEDLENTKQLSRTIDVPPWIARATIDIIGLAAFDYDFKSMDDQDDPVVRSYNNFMKDTFGMATVTQIFFESICHYMPGWLLTRLNNVLPGESLRKARENKAIVHKLAHSLIQEKSDALMEGKGNRDVLSLLINANMSEDPKTRLSEYEIISQMRTVLLAGHETTANSLSFLLLELAKHPEVQTIMRQEIQEIKSSKLARGEPQLNVNDLETMSYTIAVIKETLRIHPIVYHIMRVAGRDDVLPLSEPIVTKSGETITGLPIPEGTNLILGFAAYNRNKKVWGADADEFKPDRWLTTTKRDGPTVGVYNNLLTFSGGVRACIGWRFAVLEIQTLLIELVSNFEFTMTEESKRVRRMPCAVMVPVIEGQEDKGVQLPLNIALVAN